MRRYHRPSTQATPDHRRAQLARCQDCRHEVMFGTSAERDRAYRLVKAEPDPLRTLPLRCQDCRHEVMFGTSAERDRFATSSGWTEAEGQPICPVCAS